MNQEEILSRLSDEVRVRQVGKYKRGSFFGLLDRDKYYFYVTTDAGGKRFYHRNCTYIGEDTNKQVMDNQLRAEMQVAANKAVKEFRAPKPTIGKLEATFKIDMKTGNRVKA